MCYTKEKISSQSENILIITSTSQYELHSALHLLCRLEWRKESKISLSCTTTDLVCVSSTTLYTCPPPSLTLTLALDSLPVSVRVNPLTNSQLAIFVLGKCFYIAYYFILPCFYMHLAKVVSQIMITRWSSHTRIFCMLFLFPPPSYHYTDSLPVASTLYLLHYSPPPLTSLCILLLPPFFTLQLLLVVFGDIVGWFWVASTSQLTHISAEVSTQPNM